jgi:SpoVK/Ycf46/Vps4 family AAA+-type ATPase
MNDTTRKLKQEFLKQMHELDNEDEILVLGIAAYPWELDSTVRKCFQKKNIYNFTGIKCKKNLIRIKFKKYL